MPQQPTNRRSRGSPKGSGRGRGGGSSGRGTGDFGRGGCGRGNPDTPQVEGLRRSCRQQGISPPPTQPVAPQRTPTPPLPPPPATPPVSPQTNDQNGTSRRNRRNQRHSNRLSESGHPPSLPDLIRVPSVENASSMHDEFANGHNVNPSFIGDNSAINRL